MIIREHEHAFILIKQHDHARLSGEIAKKLRKEFLLHQYIPEVILAAYEHDRGWIPLDSQVAVNPATLSPYSFQDYPLQEKIDSYTRGLNEIEDLNPYAGLLCSLHYAFFFKTFAPPESAIFIQNEAFRRERIMKELEGVEQELIDAHLDILQFCDRLSLYVCLNDPGATKEQEHEWYREGISHSERLNPTGRGPVLAEWLNNHEIKVTGFPFEEEFQSSIRYGTVSKEYMTPVHVDPTKIQWEEQEIRFRK